MGLYNLKIFNFRETKKCERLARALLKTQGKPFYICIILIILLMCKSMQRKQQARKALSIFLVNGFSCLFSKVTSNISLFIYLFNFLQTILLPYKSQIKPFFSPLYFIFDFSTFTPINYLAQN